MVLLTLSKHIASLRCESRRRRGVYLSEKPDSCICDVRQTTNGFISLQESRFCHLHLALGGLRP